MGDRCASVDRGREPAMGFPGLSTCIGGVRASRGDTRVFVSGSLRNRQLGAIVWHPMVKPCDYLGRDPRSIEQAIAELSERYARLPEGHPQHSELARMIDNLEGELQRREKAAPDRRG